VKSDFTNTVVVLRSGQSPRKGLELVSQIPILHDRKSPILYILSLSMEAVYTSKMSQTLSTTIHCKHLRAELTSNTLYADFFIILHAEGPATLLQLLTNSNNLSLCPLCHTLFVMLRNKV
jgi:hypothetical protein